MIKDQYFRNIKYLPVNVFSTFKPGIERYRCDCYLHDKRDHFHSYEDKEMFYCYMAFSDFNNMMSPAKLWVCWSCRDRYAIRSLKNWSLKDYKNWLLGND